MSTPTVSVIIPTYQRPDLVCDAIRSALAQSFTDLEVIVVVDGGDPATVTALDQLKDPRLRVLTPTEQMGNAAARNHGLDAATGTWIALLDDDDVWMKEKLSIQLDAAKAAQSRGIAMPIVSCRFVARSDTASFVWPRHLPEPSQPLSEYLFCRKRPGTGDGVVQTSTMLVPGALFDQARFDPDCKRFVDVDWILRAVQIRGVEVVFPDARQPLSLWAMDDRPRISLEGAWRDDVDWIKARRHLTTSRARAAFLLTLPSIRAAREGDIRALWLLLQAALSEGRPGLAELVFHVANFTLPHSLKHWLARRAAGPSKTPSA
ncbi:glycosyltransferase family 2 protein [Litoreibacter roseus]|uniref:Glycosyl transferase n=1 Tax=Litoreibacter roseus TaxID=2601869 RepID=A0A6N6JI67_9RHOB|nr:glycosyltransferase family 2 protein [Litoreibacter roseus]GFE64902.1 glycosyl transferase [Litoreibacter roseus]